LGTLADLLATVADGSAIEIPTALAAGTAAVVINKSVHLFSRNRTVLEDSILVASGATLQISGLICRGRIGLLPKCVLVVNDCRFEPVPHASISVVGPGSRVEATRSSFNLRHAGIAIRAGAVGKVTDCRFDPGDEAVILEHPAVVVSDSGSRLEVSESRFANPSGGAVSVRYGAEAVVTSCRFESSKAELFAAVSAAAKGSTVEVHESVFVDLNAYGLMVQDGAAAIVSGCRFESISRTAIGAGGPGSRIKLNKSRFTNLQSNAVLAVAGAEIGLSECTFKSIAQPAVGAWDPSSLVELDSCVFAELAESGVLAFDSGSARVTKCDFDQIRRPAIGAMGPGSRLQAAESRFTRLEIGVIVGRGAEAGIFSCNFDEPLASAIEVFADQSQIRLEGNSFRGENFRITGSIGHSEAAKGASITTDTRFPSPCADCEGSGGRPSTALRGCPACRQPRTGAAPTTPGDTTKAPEVHSQPAGSGVPPIRLSGSCFFDPPPCTVCRGTCLIADHMCSTCAGEGGFANFTKVELEIPAGVESGARIQIHGRGGAGVGRGMPGDLEVVLHVLEPAFRTVEDFIEKKLGVEIAVENSNDPTAQTSRTTTAAAPGTLQAGISDDPVHRAAKVLAARRNNPNWWDIPPEWQDLFVEDARRILSIAAPTPEKRILAAAQALAARRNRPSWRDIPSEIQAEFLQDVRLIFESDAT